MEPFDLRKWPEFLQLTKQPETKAVVDQIVIDSRRIFSKNALFVALPGATSDGHDFVRQAWRSGARYAIVRKDWKPSWSFTNFELIPVEDPLRALQQIAHYYRLEMQAKVVAIVGSYGKTMLKDLLAHILSKEKTTYSSPESFNSQIGVALSLLKIQKKHEIALIEAGISKEGEMGYLSDMIKPDHVILTNIAKVRLGTIGNEENLAKEKILIAQCLAEGNWRLLPSDPYILKEIGPCKDAIFWDRVYNTLPVISRKEDNAENSLNYEITFPTNQVFKGSVTDGHTYVLDLLKLGVKAAFLLGMKPDNIVEQLSSYFPEPMRIDVWKSSNGVTFINDTYCADPMSCEVALRQFDSLEETSSKDMGKKLFLFGGMRFDSENSENDMARVAHSIAKHKVDLVILWQPKVASQLVSHLALISPHTDVLVAKDFKQAIQLTRMHVTNGDRVLIKGGQKVAVLDTIKEFEDSPPNNLVIINLAAIQSNIETLRAKLSPRTRMMVMVKALAYGTDDIRIAKFLKSCGVDILGVSYVDEGVSMRQAGVNQSIFVLNAAVYEAAKATKWDLEIGVSELGLIDALQKQGASQGKKIKVHLHVDTGMSRFGCRPEVALELSQRIQESSHLIYEGILTHFACADDPNQDAFTLRQAQIFQETIDKIEAAGYSPKWKHACNSSAAIRFGFSSFNMVRLGLAVYGLHASQASNETCSLRPAISLVSRIVGINVCQKGDTISYGRTHQILQDSAKIAVLPIGYFDGLHRNYSGKGEVMIRGKKAPMIGRICMDYMMADISDIPHAQIGDQALIFGEDESGQYLSPEALAQAGGSIVHELMTCLGPRIRRLFIYDEALRPR